MRGSRLWLLPLAFGALAFAPSGASHEPRAAASVGAPSSTAAPAIAPPAAAAASFDPASTRLPDGAPEHAVREALERDDAVQALALARTALTTAVEPSRGRLSWLLARAEPDEQAAQAHLQALAVSAHALAPWAALLLAERVAARDPGRAVALAEPLQRGFAGGFRARLTLALAQRPLGRPREGETRLRALLSEQKPDASAAAIALPLAEELARRPDLASRLEALALCRRIVSRSPLGLSAPRAGELARKLVAKLPPKARAAHARPGVDDELARGDALLDARRYDEARAVFEQLARRVKRDTAARCKVGLAHGRALFQARDRAAAASLLSALAPRCADPDVKAWSRYYAASAKLRTADPRGAVAEYDALLRETPEHSLADDALYLQSTAHQDLGDAAAARAALLRLLARYPRGDHTQEARMALAFEARGRGDHATALQHLDALVAEGADERTEGAEGRAQYWRARTLAVLGRADEAKTAYAGLLRAWPLSYHAQQAHARLLELDARLAAQVSSELHEPAGASPLRFVWRKELETPGFARAVALLQVGADDLAELELRALGVYGGGDDELRWLGAAVLDANGAHAPAMELVRSKLRSFRATLPRGRARQLWRLAYPRAYSPLIEQVAGERGVPAELIRAVAREESSFNPRVVSTALAYGLIQLIRPTAKIHAAPLGLPSDPASLKRPEVNLRIGSHFLSWLLRRYPQNQGVVPAAYNAGYAAVDRWLRERGALPLDEWVERIPYRETRRYTRRVLQSYGVYAWLDRGQLPSLPATLPLASAP